MSVVFFHTMKYKPDDPRNANCDRFVLSKKQQFVDVATGSLGQGLGAACGMAYTGKYFDKASYRVFCLLGDGELSEGSVWEAMAFASFYQLNNLVAILDINRLGQSDPAPLQHHVEKYKKRCEAFGWHTVIVDGHSVEELCEALCQSHDQPSCIVARTFKGKGILDTPAVCLKNIHMPSEPSYKLGEKMATRKAYGLALAKLGRSQERVVVLDADTKNSTFSELFKNEFPNRYVECYIAEQNMVSVAVGFAARDRNVVFASTFATFFTRAYDQLRMAAISESNINLCGSHCGVSIGEDGPSQMALEDLAMFRAIPTATVFYPSDGVSTEKAVELAANTKGICFIRSSRPENPVIYNSNEAFSVGQAKVVLKTNNDQVTVIGAAVTLYEALDAAEQLKKEGINIRVIDPFTIKPLDSKTIIENGRATGGRIITVEDHYYEGGLGEAVCSAVVNEHDFTVRRLAVSHVPRSGKPRELLKMFNIDCDAIVQASLRPTNVNKAKPLFKSSCDAKTCDRFTLRHAKSTSTARKFGYSKLHRNMRPLNVTEVKEGQFYANQAMNSKHYNRCLLRQPSLRPNPSGGVLQGCIREPLYLYEKNKRNKVKGRQSRDRWQICGRQGRELVSNP
ncbi:Transketolase [Bagarius yarrelli]|uniref:transketolase n=1 Tax=Bagarius yarrelli TaxID=175774 RepID=A0A556U1W7_BAGYA|nr:Transketolase [Bagarius yarrelli]